MKRIVIIGGGPAGRVVVHRIFHSGQQDNFDIKLIKDEENNVNRCAIPYGISGKKEIGKYIISNKLVTDFGAELIIGTAERIDRQEKKVYLASGQVYSYDILVLATGATPVLPPIPGLKKTSRIQSMRRIEDLEWIREKAIQSESVAIVGAGFIGVEFAVELRKKGVKNVYLVEMLEHILGAQYPAPMLEELENKLSEEGITVMTSHQVKEIQESETSLKLILSGDKTIEVDCAVISVGVSSNTKLAEDAKLEVSRFGIVVDEHMRTNDPSIYSAGDCTQTLSYLSGKPLRGEFGTNAVFMAQVLADELLGRSRSFKGVLNASASTIYDYAFGSTGLNEEQASSHGYAPVTGYSEVLNRYPMMEGVSKIKTVLVFDKNTRRLLGAQALCKGTGLARHIDMLSWAIQKNSLLDEMLDLQYATHPELAAKPSDNTIVFACKDALKKM